jgi:hypothetical protein
VCAYHLRYTEAEIRKIVVQVSLGKKVCEPHLIGKKLGVVAHACHPSYLKKHKTGRSKTRLAQAKNKALSPKKGWGHG